MRRYDQVAGFILAGGASSRMRRDKALLEIGGIPLLVRAARLLEPLVTAVTVIGHPERYAALGLRIVPDDVPHLGPLGGMTTALRISSSPWNLIVGCDIPYLSAAWLDWLIARGTASAADAVLPETARGLEPLCAVYRKSCGPVLAAAIARGVRKVTDGVADLAVEKVDAGQWQAFDSDGVLLKNMNTPADFEEARALLERKAAR